MEQYYILNDKISEYKIAVAPKCEKIITPTLTEHHIKEIKRFEELEDCFDLRQTFKHMSIKSPEYIKKRYFMHPIYKYRCWIVVDSKNDAEGFFFGREIRLNDAKILRIVDFRGELGVLECIGVPLYDLMYKEGFEYIDLMASDLSMVNMGKAGFERLNPDGDVVIPHYFEPFVQNNIKNYYQSNADVVIFKADGDQDRPNFRKGK